MTLNKDILVYFHVFWYLKAMTSKFKIIRFFLKKKKRFDSGHCRFTYFDKNQISECV